MPDSRVSVTTEVVAHAPLERTFRTVIDIDLTAVSRAVGPLPAIVEVRDQPADWGRAAGQRRTLLMSDKGTMAERLTHVDPPNGFGYVIGDITGPLRLLVRDVWGTWTFTPNADDTATTIRWTFAFGARPFAGPAVRAIAKIWPRYAGPMLGRAARVAEAEAAAAATRSAEPAAS